MLRGCDARRVIARHSHLLVSGRLTHQRNASLGGVWAQAVHLHFSNLISWRPTLGYAALLRPTPGCTIEPCWLSPLGQGTRFAVRTTSLGRERCCSSGARRLGSTSTNVFRAGPRLPPGPHRKIEFRGSRVEYKFDYDSFLNHSWPGTMCLVPWCPP